MADLLAILQPPQRHATSERRFAGAVEAATAGLGAPLAHLHRGEGTRVATFARRDGSGGALAVDPRGRGWLAALGTWFHDSGLASGQEAELLELIARRGFARVAAELDGSWALVRGRDGRIDVATDRVGECRVYVVRSGDTWLLSGSSLLLGALTGAAVDPTGCQEFLCTGVIYEDRSLFSGVERLLGGRCTTFTPAERRELPIWAPPTRLPQLGLDEAATALFEGLRGAADRIARRFDRVACDLTGGYDSRAVLAGFLAAGHRVDTTVRGDAGDADVTIAGRIARQQGLALHRYPARIDGAADHLDEALRLTDGEYEIGEYAAIALLHEDLSQHHEISVNGSFGEMSRGYWFELLGRDAARPGRLDARRIARARYATGSFDADLFDAPTRIDLGEHMAAVVARAAEGLEDLPLGTQLTITYARVRMAGWQARIASATNRIWPCVSPFLFRAPFDLPLRTAPEVMRNGRLVRRMLELHAPDLARLPLADGHPAQLLRWHNAHRFLPWAGHLARRVLDRVARPLRRGSGAPRSAPDREELSDRLAGCGAFDEAALDRFLSAAASPGFGYHDQWLRLRTLDRCLAARQRLAELAAGAREDTAATA